MAKIRSKWLCVLLGTITAFTLSGFLLHPNHAPQKLKVFPVTDKSHTVKAPSHKKCAPAPLKFHVGHSLFDCNWPDSSPPHCDQRLRAKLACSKFSEDIVFEWVSVDTPPSVYDLADDCLMRVVKAKCYDGGEEGSMIPRLSHHVLFGGHELRNYTFLAILSAVRFLQPCLIFIHADQLPRGPHWDTLVRLFPLLIHVKRAPPSEIFGHKVKVIEHSSDIARLEAVKKFGGVYQDTDYVLLNSLDDLRHHHVVMGKTIPNTNYCNCIFMGRPEAAFLQAWYQSYHSFDDRQWGYHSTILPYKLHHQRPELPFHEVDTFVTPYFADIEKVFYKDFLPWKRLHGLHLYVRFYNKYFVGNFHRKNTSLGQISRRILFGNAETCFRSLQ